jgi:hypothetical protein
MAGVALDAADGGSIRPQGLKQAKTPIVVGGPMRGGTKPGAPVRRAETGIGDGAS